MTHYLIKKTHLKPLKNKKKLKKFVKTCGEHPTPASRHNPRNPKEPQGKWDPFWQE